MAEHFLTNAGFLEILVINLLNLYRVLMVSRDESIPLVKRLRDELHNPKPGDIILELNSQDQPPAERLGFLDTVIPKGDKNLYLIQKLNGDYEASFDRHIIKVPREIIYAPG